MDDDRTMTRVEAAAYLTEKGRPTKVSTLAKYAGDGRGPPFTKEDRSTIYKQSDLDTWFAQGMSRAAGRPRKARANGKVETALPPKIVDLRALLIEHCELAERFANSTDDATAGFKFARNLDKLRRLVS